MITGIAHVALVVRDYDEAKNFYCEKLGFTILEIKIKITIDPHVTSYLTLDLVGQKGEMWRIQ